MAHWCSLGVLQAGADALLVLWRARKEAARTVRVPPSVINLIADLRAHLQQSCEPPIYVSDRRLVKAVRMLQVRPCESARTGRHP